jgi:multicomponent Na+:H+ antiporter subunit E
VSYLALNLLLALVWMFLSGTFGVGSLLAGYAVGFLSLAILQPVVGSRRYVQGVFGVMRLVVIYLLELLIAAGQLARDILRPNPPIRGGFLQYDARHLSPGKTVLLSNMLSLTPGTLTVDVDDEGDFLYIHTVYAHDIDKIRRGVDLFAALISGVSRVSDQPARKEFDKWRPS